MTCQPIMKPVLKLPITNVYAKGDYCTTLYIGSEKAPVNLIIDSGSSTLVVKEASYQAAKDKDLVATTIAQEVNYGIGGWNGPVVHSTVAITNHNQESTDKVANGEKQQVQLTCKPQTYWQVNTPSYGKACFRFLSQLPQWPNQSIIGLPLLNNYYVIFDRSVDSTGVIKFAKQK